jgi:hypothetical protein
MTRQTLITEFYKPILEKKVIIIKGYNILTDSWHCIICGQDLGPTNPRQFCRKTYCEYDNFYIDN